MKLLKGKNIKLVKVINHLFNKFGKNKFLLADHWGDEFAIGLTDTSSKYLVYISTIEQTKDTVFVSLENPPNNPDDIYEPAGNFENVNLDYLESIVSIHLLRF